MIDVHTDVHGVKLDVARSFSNRWTGTPSLVAKQVQPCRCNYRIAHQSHWGSIGAASWYQEMHMDIGTMTGHKHKLRIICTSRKLFMLKPAAMFSDE